jgi:REP element-mobilizing transposase RayT
MPSSLSNLLYHIVYSTKNREPRITTYKKDLHKFICSNIIQEGGQVFSVNGTDDHIHIAAKLLPRNSVSNILKLIKGNSSKWVNEQNKCRSHFSWQKGYGAFTISKSKLNTVIRYINSQEVHHRKKTFKEEFIDLLDVHEIEYDERYVWD